MKEGRIAFALINILHETYETLDEEHTKKFTKGVRLLLNARMPIALIAAYAEGYKDEYGGTK